MKYETMMLLIYMLCPLTFGLMMSELDSRRFSKLITFLLGAGITSLYVILMWPIWNTFMPAKAVIYPLVLFAVIWGLCTAPAKTKIRFFIIYYLITMLSEISCLGYGLLILRLPTDSILIAGNSLEHMLMCAVSPAFMMTYSTIHAVFHNQMESALRRRIIVLFLLLLVSHCMFATAIGMQSISVTAEEIAGYAVACELVNIVVQYVAFETINRSVAAVRDRFELENLREKQKMDQKYVQMARENAEEMAAFRHDFKNQLQVAYALLEHEPERAALFLKKLEEKVEETGIETHNREG